MSTAQEIPEQVQTFLSNFARRIKQRKESDILTSYQKDFVRLSERYYAKTTWPSSSAIANFVQNDENFLVLYNELYSRHIHNYLVPSVDDRLDSFGIYSEVFNALVGLKTDAPELELPAVWLSDLVEEFVYQFQTFHQFRAKAAADLTAAANSKDNKSNVLSAADIASLRSQDSAWSPQAMFRQLHDLAKKGGMAVSVSNQQSAANDEKKGEQKIAPMFRQLAHFALIGLCRLNCLMGDFYSAVRVLENVDSSKRNVALQVSQAQVSQYYYLGLANLMCRRYGEANKHLSSFCHYMASRALQDGGQRVSKRIDQMYGLLAMCNALAPQRLAEPLQSQLRDRFGDKIQRLHRCERAAFEDLFLASTPKFVSAFVPPILSAKAEKDPSVGAGLGLGAVDAQQVQLQGFLQEVATRSGPVSLPDLLSYLKLCTSINLSQLSAFLSKSGSSSSSSSSSSSASTGSQSALSQAQVNQALLSLKQKSRAVRSRSSAEAINNISTSSSNKRTYSPAQDLDFAINKDVVIVSEYKAARRYGEVFIRHILSLSRMTDDIVQSNSAKGL